MKRSLVLLLAVTVSAGLAQRKGGRGAAPNTLTPEEQKEGFELLDVPAE